MKTEILTWQQSERIAEILREGGIVCFPTETVYGLGCVSRSEAAFNRLVAIKKRPPEKPFTLMCATLTQVAMNAEVDAKAAAVLRAYMPGPITALLKARPAVARFVTLGLPTIGVRVPDSPEVRSMIEKAGCPLLVPSANISGEPAAKSFEEAKSVFDGVVDAIVDGECQGGRPSTIIDLSKGSISLVREGPISYSEIKSAYEKALPFKVALASDHGGFAYKEAIKMHLVKAGYSPLDFGTNSTASCDYPLFAKDAAQAVASHEADLGVLVCTSGEGISMAANKVKGVRCGIGYDDVATGKTREHNNANMVAFGQAYMPLEDVLRRVDIFLLETFSIEKKHARRVDQVNSIA